MMQQTIESRDIARAAILMATSGDREHEHDLRASYALDGIRAAAVDYGGEFGASIMRMVERTVVAAKREGVIEETHHEEGAVAGAVREAITQIMPKAFGLNIGGKIGIARRDEHIAVAVFMGIGLLHLNEVAIGLGHRAV